jgi:cytoskeletal protein CcmA (bactofilin family)
MVLWRQDAEKEQFRSETEEREGSLSQLGVDRSFRKGAGNSENGDSVIAETLTIEGKIEGSGHVRIAGRFKGDVHINGDLTVENGAHISGEIRVVNIVVKGEVEGNIFAESGVELYESGVLIGDVKASSLTVAAGSRMRGKVEFGWDERETVRPLAIEGVESDL